MPFLGFALDDDIKALTSRVDELDSRTTALQKCTPLIRGVHLCHEPMYGMCTTGKCAPYA